MEIVGRLERPPSGLRCLQPKRLRRLGRRLLASILTTCTRHQPRVWHRNRDIHFVESAYPPPAGRARRQACRHRESGRPA